MSEPIILKINVQAIVKEWLFKGAKGTYLDCVLYESDRGPDEYGNTHSLKQSPSKAARDAGEKGPYIGNGKFMQSRGAGQRSAAPPRQSTQWASRTGDPLGGNKNYVPPAGGGGGGNPEEDDIPFAPLNSVIGGVA